MNKQLLAVARTAAIIMIIVAGCRSGNEHPGDAPSDADTTLTLDGVAFTPDLPPGHVLDTLVRKNLDGAGGDELIVTSMLPDSLAPPDARADYLQIYRFDSLSGRYRLVLSDSMRWATMLRFEELGGDSSAELGLYLNSGGNDEVASRGVNIYSGSGGTIRRIYHTSRGNPSILSRNEGKKDPLIVLQGEYWPPILTHAQAIYYVADYLLFRDSVLVSVRSENRAEFINSAQKALEEYAELRKGFAALPEPPDSVDQGDTATAAMAADTLNPLFIPAARAMIHFRRADAVRSLRSFWDSEREFLEHRLPPAQFHELQQLYGG